ncbi:hypothetical protein [Lentzea sp. NPDC051838]|uniref:terpene synthase family protein n=1 Tax=Lentzea sp. NPDC051838 TaxID=3154849 RepID=UPI003420BCB9
MHPDLLTFYCPLPQEVSEQHDDLRENTLTWVRKFDLADGDPQRTIMLAFTGAAYSAYATPHATGATAQALSDYNAWAWAANDVAGSDLAAGELIVHLGRWERLMRSPGSFPQATDPMDVALDDVFSRLRDLLTPVQWERFVAGQSQWLYSMGWEVGLREQGGPATLNDYLAVRIGSVGCYSAVSYIDAVEGIELDEQQWASRTVRAAAESAMLVAALDNDRTSYNRERKLSVRKHNIFDVVRAEHPETSFENAVSTAIGLRDRAMTLYLQLRKRILDGADDTMSRYVAGIDRIVSGNIDLATAAVRYLDPETSHLFRRVDVPQSTAVPLSVPTVSWWWKCV